MYDRKTWVVLAVCGALLAANVYYSGKNQQIQREKDVKARQTQVERDKLAAAEAAPSRESQAGLTVETPPPPTEEEFKVLKNDKVAFTLTNIGGGIKNAELLEQFEVHSKTNHVTINRFGSGPIGAIAGRDESLENVPYAYKAEQSVEGKKVVYVAKLSSGLVIKKTFSLIDSKETGAPYLLDLEVVVENASTAPVKLGDWSLFLGEASPLYQKEWIQQTGFFWRKGGGINFTDVNSFKGGMISSAKSVQTSPAGENIEYAGVTNQFFATVLRPKETAATSMWAKSSQITLPGDKTPMSSVNAGLHFPAVDLKPGDPPKSIGYRIFIGPKHNPLLRKMDKNWGEGWGDVMQYGWFWFVSRPLNALLNWYHALLDGVTKQWSWGLAIILLTITVRIFIWPLHAKSTHTMKRMAKLKPEMDKLKEKYPDDPNKLNTEVMGLYRKYGINPVGGCLPMFLQIPIFFGFYRMLQYAVELRGQGFLWVPDLLPTGHARHLPSALLAAFPRHRTADQHPARGHGHHQLPADPDDSEHGRQDPAAHHPVDALHVLLLLL